VPSSANKYIYLLVIQGNYGLGFEDLCEYPDQPKDGPDTEAYGGGRKECWHDIKEYRLAEPSYSHRVIRRRQLREPEIQ
jgi:hypothetical protein